MSYPLGSFKNSEENKSLEPNVIELQDSTSKKSLISDLKKPVEMKKPQQGYLP